MRSTEEHKEGKVSSQENGSREPAETIRIIKTARKDKKPFHRKACVERVLICRAKATPRPGPTHSEVAQNECVQKADDNTGQVALSSSLFQTADVVGARGVTAGSEWLIEFSLCPGRHSS